MRCDSFLSPMAYGQHCAILSNVQFSHVSWTVLPSPLLHCFCFLGHHFTISITATDACVTCSTRRQDIDSARASRSSLAHFKKRVETRWWCKLTCPTLSWCCRSGHYKAELHWPSVNRFDHAVAWIVHYNNVSAVPMATPGSPVQDSHPNTTSKPRTKTALGKNRVVMSTLGSSGSETIRTPQWAWWLRQPTSADLSPWVRLDTETWRCMIQHLHFLIACSRWAVCVCMYAGMCAGSSMLLCICLVWKLG